MAFVSLLSALLAILVLVGTLRVRPGRLRVQAAHKGNQLNG